MPFITPFLFFVIILILCYRKIKTSQEAIFLVLYASGGGLEDLILLFQSIGNSNPFKEIISPFHRSLLLNLRLWKVYDCEELVGANHRM